MTPEVVALIAGEVEHGARAARAIYDGVPGHPVLIGRELYDEVLALDGDTGAKDLLAAEHAGRSRSPTSPRPMTSTPLKSWRP